MVEIFDQMVRVQSGGEMLKLFEQVKASQDSDMNHFIMHRVGDNLLAQDNQLNSHFKNRLKNLTLDKLRTKLLSYYLKALYYLIPSGIRSEVMVQTSVGERHKWLYDSFSLPRLLAQCGFTHTQIMRFDTSNIENFNQYLLDINTDSTPYKGVSSLYVEARKQEIP